MSENRKYYYMKLKENFFTDAKMVILESMQDGLLYSNLLLKMYLMSLKYNGILMLNDHLPHTPQTIATFTRHQIGTVERAIKVFLEFGFVEILTDGSYYMADNMPRSHVLLGASMCSLPKMNNRDSIFDIWIPEPYKSIGQCCLAVAQFRLNICCSKASTVPWLHKPFQEAFPM